MGAKIMAHKIKCLKCGDILESFAVHDLKSCRCGSVFIDGGGEYLRVGWKGKAEDTWEELPSTPLERELSTQVSLLNRFINILLKKLGGEVTITDADLADSSMDFWVASPGHSDVTLTIKERED
jgi:hypothetical protein